MNRENSIARVWGASCFRLVALAGLLPFAWGCPALNQPECQPDELRVAALFDTIVNEGTLVNLQAVFLCQPSTGGAVQEQTFQWVQVSPASPVAAISGANNANASFVAPLVDQDTDFVFQVNVRSVRENGTFESSDTLNVSVRNLGNPAAESPAPAPIPNQLINEGQNIQLDPASLFDLSSFDNQVLGFVWKQIRPAAPVLDISDPNAAMPTVSVLFPNPVRGSQIELMYQLTVDVAPPSGAGIPSGQVIPASLPAVGTLRLFVNQFPEADAGDEGIATEGSAAFLDGTRSFDPEDPENPAALTYFWELIDFIATPTTPSGPDDVVLDDPTSPTPSFIAPPVSGTGAILVFQLTVSDGVLESTDTTEIVVRKSVPRGPGSPVDPCADVVCPPNSTCDGEGVCVCDPGFMDDSNGGCVPDPCADVVCPPNSTCDGEGVCVCDPGFMPNFNTALSVVSDGACVPDPCFDVVCPPNSTCDGEGVCVCDPGFMDDSNGDCVIDPCFDVVCPPNSTCDGEGVCVCDPGFMPDSNGDCVIDPCFDVVCPPNSTCDGQGACVCDPGFVLDPNGDCVPDPCFDVVCPPNSTCDGQGACVCDPGFVLDPNGDCVAVAQ